MKKLLLYAAALTFIFGLSTFNCTAQFTKLLDFAGSVNGKQPYGSLISDGTFLYGMTKYGGTNDAYGTVFKIKPDGTGDSIILDFNSTNGSAPLGSLFSDGTFLYGMPSGGGAHNYGVIFKIMPDGTGDSILYNFGLTNGPNGSNPFYGALISDSTFFYGMTYAGGANSGPNSEGTVFKIKHDGTGYVNLHSFAGYPTYGSAPCGALISDGTFLYGMTQYGGTNNMGIIFKIKTDGTGYLKLLDFTGTANGSIPFGSLISDGTFLYGMTNAGGLYNKGVIFKIKPDGTSYSDILDFAGIANGSAPSGSLIFDGIFLYGMTTNGGTNNDGTIFKIKSDGTNYFKLFDFSSTSDGKSPYGDLLLDGAFLYGMTSFGGTYDYGTVFKYALVTGITENNSTTGFNVFPNPTTGTFTISFSQPELVSGSQMLKQVQHDVSIYNVLGENIYQSEIKNQKAEIDLSNQPAGIYFLNIKTNEGTVIKKIIKE